MALQGKERPAPTGTDTDIGDITQTDLSNADLAFFMELAGAFKEFGYANFLDWAGAELAVVTTAAELAAVNKNRILPLAKVTTAFGSYTVGQLLLYDHVSDTWKVFFTPSSGGSGNTKTVGTTFPTNPNVGDLHELNADTSLTAIAGEYNIVGETNSSQYVASAADPNDIRAFYNPHLSPPSLFARYKAGQDISGFLDGQSGDALLFIPTSGTAIKFDLGQAPTNSANARQLNFTNMVSPPNTNPMTDGATYTIAILYQSRTFKKDTVFRWNGTYWVRALVPIFPRDFRDFETAKTAAYTVVRADDGKIIPINTGAANVTLTLPDLGVRDEGFTVAFLKTAAPNTATIDGHSTDTINGHTTITLSEQYEVVILRWDGTTWYIFDETNKRTLSNVAFEGAKTANYTVISADEQKVIPVNTTSGNLTVNLPDLGSTDNGFLVTVLKTVTPNTLTVNPHGTDRINAGTTLTITGGGHAVTIGWDGTAWWVLDEANRPASATNITLANLPRTTQDYLYTGTGSGSPVTAKPPFDTTETQQSSGTLDYDSGTLSGSDSAGSNDPADYGDVSDASITSEAFAGGRIYRIAAGYDFTALRIRFDGTVTQGVAFQVRYSTTKPSTTNLSTHGTQLQQVGTVSNVFEQDGTISNPADELWFWGLPTATRTITSRKLRLDGSYTKTENVDVDGVIELGDGLEVDSAGKLAATQYPEFESVKTAAYAVVAADNGRVIPVNTTSGDLTVTLPDLGASDDGFEVTILKTAAANDVTVAGHGTDTINGVATLIVQRHYESVRLGWDGTTWWVLGEANESRSSQANASYGFSEVLWATSDAFVDGDLADTGTLDFTIASNAASGVADGANTKVAVPKVAPDNVTAIRVQLLNAANTVIDELDIPWGDTSSVLARKLEDNTSDSYVSFTFDLVNRTTPTFTFTAENSSNGITGYYIKINAILLAPNQTYTPQIPETKNGVHRRCIAELEGTTGSTAPGLSLITAAYTPQNANARIYVRLRIVAYAIGNSDNDYSQICVRVKRGTNNYKRIDEQADGFTAIAGQRMWQYSDNTARAHYEEFELEPENNTDEIKVNLAIYMKDGASVSSTTGRLNRWGSNRNLGPSFIEIYELMENGTIARTTITSLDSA